MGWSEPEPPRGQFPRLFEVRALGNGLCLASGFFSVWSRRFLPPQSPHAACPGNVKDSWPPPRLPLVMRDYPGEQERTWKLLSPLGRGCGGSRAPCLKPTSARFVPGDPAGPARLRGPAPGQTDSGGPWTSQLLLGRLPTGAGGGGGLRVGPRLQDPGRCGRQPAFGAGRLFR